MYTLSQLVANKSLELLFLNLSCFKSNVQSYKVGKQQKFRVSFYRKKITELGWLKKMLIFNFEFLGILHQFKMAMIEKRCILGVALNQGLKIVINQALKNAIY